MIVRRIGLWLCLLTACWSAGCDCGASPVATDAAMDSSNADTGSDLDSGAVLDAAQDAAEAADATHDADGPTVDGGIVRGCQSPACDLIDNGCGGNRACYYLPTVSNGTPQPRCVTAGDNAAGTVCSTQEQCAPGLGCDPSNRCRNYCCAVGTGDGCPQGEACLVEYRDSNDESLGVGLCQECDACDPVTSDGCDVGRACYPATSDGACRLCLAPRVNGNVGAVCTTHSDCRVGLGCLGGTPQRCARFCSVATGDGCEVGDTCTAIGYTGLPDLGFCPTP
jgi:hypothetical protein